MSKKPGVRRGKAARPKRGAASRPAKPAPRQAAKLGPAPREPEPVGLASVLRFDASNPEVQAFARSHGWDRPGLKVTVFQAELVYTPDGWQTTRTAPLQYLSSGVQGFVLRGVPEGTPLEFAVHVQVGVSPDNFYSLAERGDFWANNGGQNHRAPSEGVRR